MNELLALGISHKTAPVALRERLAFTEEEAVEFARAVTASAEVREAVIISTCNRSEIYLVVGDPVRAESDVLGLLARRADIRPTELAEAIYSPRNCDAARHLYRVTAGLESMIVGEAEIQGQVRRAHEAAMRAGCTGPLSNRMFAAALTTGKRVRSETEIGASRVSVPSVAVDLALSVLGELEQRHVVILGAGETSELTARALAEQGAGTIFVANRHADRALSLAQRFGGSVVGLDKLPDQLLQADIVLSSTSSPHPIVGREELAVVMAERRGRPLLLIDIAVPRDIDPTCAELEGVSLYDIDDLQAVVARNLSSREVHAPRALEIVEEEIHRFARWLGQLDALPTVSALREHGSTIVEQVLAENSGRWESASARDIARVEAIARAIMSRLLHEPTIRLRSLSSERGHASLEIVRELFGLQEDAAEQQAPSAAELAEVHDLSDRRSARRRPRTALMRLGTRRSALALAQAEIVASFIGDCEIVPIVTSGDRGARQGDKSRWVTELEQALTNGEIDLAVHSAKDLPGELADGLALLGAPARAGERGRALRRRCSGGADARRAGRDEQHPPNGSAARGARGSRGGRAARQRRHAPAQARRGRSRAASDRARPCGARASRARERGGGVLDPARFVPAPGQGVIALEGRAEDNMAAAGAQAITEASAFACLLAERALARAPAGELPHAARRARA